ncbi:MAG TPA: phytanoyl-CoA dioxygenase family protein [Acidimicrobiales bacterium]|nr:phytanoyl-CoA dioxygenase family protein [Acidimicrobiales bacterium]
MRVSDATLAEVRERGFALMEGFLGHAELQSAREALWLHFPRPDDYFADTDAFAGYAASQFAGVEEFPYRSWDLNGLAVHPDLVDAAERYLQTTELHLYKVELWAKYAGAVNYDQPLHRDYGSHSLVVPRTGSRYQQLTTFVYLSDVTEEDGPTRLVPFEDGEHVPFTPLYIEPGSLADVEVAATGPAGSLLMYRTDILHRGSDITGSRHARFSLLADYQLRGMTWAGKMAWPKQSPQRWAKLIPRCSVRERDLFGFPRPRDPYWDDQTLADVALRYPGIDLSPYRPVAGATNGSGQAGHLDQPDPKPGTSREGRHNP